jgi:hypothetical protein
MAIKVAPHYCVKTQSIAFISSEKRFFLSMFHCQPVWAEHTVLMNSCEAGAIQIVTLREMLRERFPAAHVRPVASASAFRTGVPALDQFDVRPGALTEIVSESPHSGSGLLLAELMEKTARQGGFLALIDAADTFDPQSHDALTCSRLLWARCRKIEEALRAADLLLRDGNLPLVVLDLQGCHRRVLARVPANAWTRLGLLAEKSGATGLAFTPSPILSCAALRLRLESAFSSEILRLPRAELAARLRLRLERARSSALPLTASRNDADKAPLRRDVPLVMPSIPLRKAG